MFVTIRDGWKKSFKARASTVETLSVQSPAETYV